MKSAAEKSEELRVQALETFLAAMGFTLKNSPGSMEYQYQHSRAKLCKCGSAPCIMQSMYSPGMWLAQCPECAARTIAVSNPVMAVKAWNLGRYTPETLLCQQELVLDDIGAQNLAEGLKRSAVKDLMSAEAHGGLGSKEAIEAAWFINNDKVVQDIVSGNRRRREQEEARKEQDPYDLY